MAETKIEWINLTWNPIEGWRVLPRHHTARRGKNLACWCKPGEPCHADVLLELANGPEVR